MDFFNLATQLYVGDMIFVIISLLLSLALFVGFIALIIYLIRRK